MLTWPGAVPATVTPPWGREAGAGLHGGYNLPHVCSGSPGCVCVSSWRGGAELIFAGCPPRSTDSAAPPRSLLALRVSGWMGLGTQAQGCGLGAGGGLWDASRRSWQLKRGEAAWQQQQTAGGGGRRAGSTSTRVAQGSSGGRASERAGAKLSRKETHISHVSLAGPTAGAL